MELERAIARLVGKNNLNHLSLWWEEDSKQFVALARNTLGQRANCTAKSKDPVEALTLALVAAAKGQEEDLKRAAEAAARVKKIVPRKSSGAAPKAKKVAPRIDDEDFI